MCTNNQYINYHTDLSPMHASNHWGKAHVLGVITRQPGQAKFNSTVSESINYGELTALDYFNRAYNVGMKTNWTRTLTIQP